MNITGEIMSIDEIDRIEVEKVIHSTIGWALTKDFERLFSSVAQDEDFLSSILIRKARSSGSRLLNEWPNDRGTTRLSKPQTTLSKN
jgi:hypothetical protein